MQILFTFVNAEAAQRWDLTRFGTIAASSDDGLQVIVEPDEDWVTVGSLQRAVLASGYFGQVSIDEAPIKRVVKPR